MISLLKLRARASQQAPSRALCAVLLIATAIVAAAGDRGVPASQGIINFGKINEVLYRGAQPDAAGIRNLKGLGIKSIVNLCMPNDLWQAELAEASANGIVYTNIPMKRFGRPPAELVAQVLATIESLPSPVFVHCQHGCDRTGTIIACYRIKHDHWTGEAALAEAKRYGISVFERGMRSCILAFSKSLTSSALAKE
jgi:protein tyrosine/serine phosphatase